MREETLRDFFIGHVSPDALAQSFVGGLEIGPSVTRYAIVDMEERFEVGPLHLVRVCEAFLAGQLRASHLQAIGFILIASEAFEWDGLSSEGERIVTVANDWVSPEINYLITAENVEKWRRYLPGEGYVFEECSGSRPGGASKT